MRYFLSLGSNLGRKKQQLETARRLLRESGVRILKESSLYLTEPVDVRDQPHFLNQVLLVECGLKPEDLLSLTQDLERRMKRLPTRRFGPRRIDIDILLAGRLLCSSRRLRIPHPRLAKRRFVLTGLAEIAPRTRHPRLNKTVGRLLRETGDRSDVVKIPD